MKKICTLFINSVLVIYCSAQAGTPDITFSGDGKVTTQFSAGYDQAQGIAVQIDSKIIVAGASHNGSNYDFAIARYLVDYQYDGAFFLLPGKHWLRH